MNTVLSWDETFMAMAHVIKLRSKDPSTQVGAVIVDANNRPLSFGYNGATKGFNDKVFPWGKESENQLDTKYPFVVHAEHNAVLNFRGSLKEFEGATLYVTHKPCNECAKVIAQTGIAKVVYNEAYKANSVTAKASNIILNHAGVEVKKFNPKKKMTIDNIFPEKNETLDESIEFNWDDIAH